MRKSRSMSRLLDVGHRCASWVKVSSIKIFYKKFFRSTYENLFSSSRWIGHECRAFKKKFQRKYFWRGQEKNIFSDRSRQRWSSGGDEIFFSTTIEIDRSTLAWNAKSRHDGFDKIKKYFLSVRSKNIYKFFFYFFKKKLCLTEKFFWWRCLPKKNLWRSCKIFL